MCLCVLLLLYLNNFEQFKVMPFLTCEQTLAVLSAVLISDSIKDRFAVFGVILHYGISESVRCVSVYYPEHVIHFRA